MFRLLAVRSINHRARSVGLHRPLQALLWHTESQIVVAAGHKLLDLLSVTEGVEVSVVTRLETGRPEAHCSDIVLPVFDQCDDWRLISDDLSNVLLRVRDSIHSFSH